MRKERGVTLVTLVVTIIILLILAGITVKFIKEDKGVLLRTENAINTHKIEQYREIVDVVRGKPELRTGIDNLSSKEYMDIYEEEARKSTNLKGAEVTRRDDETVVIITKEGYVFEVREEWTKYLGKDEAFEIPELKESDILFEYQPSEWTNGKVKTKISIAKEDVNISQLILQYSLDGQKWNNYVEEIVSETNRGIYARIINLLGKEITTATGNVSNIDKLNPIEFKISATSTTNTITVTGSTTDREKTTEYGCSEIKEYYYSKDNGENWIKTDPKTTSYTFENLMQNTNYEIKMMAVDNAGNKTETDVLNKKTSSVPSLNSSNTTFAYNPSEWTKGNVNVTISTTAGNGYTLQYSKDATNWIDYTGAVEMTQNGAIYARLRDNKNQVLVKDGYATGNVSNIDKTPPTKATINLNGYTSGSWTNKNVTITASTIETQSGVAYYQYSYNGTTASGTMPNPWTISTDGEWNIYVRAVDNVGNVGEWSNVFTVKRDTVAPTISYFGFDDASVMSSASSYRAIVTASDGSSGISNYNFHLNKGNSLTTNNKYTREFTTVINDTINVTVTDKAGNSVTSNTITMTPLKVFIVQCYTHMLRDDRTVNDSEINLWTSKHGGNVQYIALAILNSDESVARKPNKTTDTNVKKQFITALYGGMLGRAPDTAGLNTHLSMMETKDRLDMGLSIVNSSEFKNICSKYNLIYKTTGSVTVEDANAQGIYTR